ERSCHHQYPDAQSRYGLTFAEADRSRQLHCPLKQQLTRNKRGQPKENEKERPLRHKRSSSSAAGLATITNPMITNAMPHHRSGEIASFKMSQQLIGTRTSTVRDNGNAIDSGMYRRM